MCRRERQKLVQIQDQPCSYFFLFHLWSATGRTEPEFVNAAEAQESILPSFEVQRAVKTKRVVVPVRQATQAGGIDFSIPGLFKRLQIRALCSEGKSDGLPVCSTTATQLLHLSSDSYLLLQAEPIFYIFYVTEGNIMYLTDGC